VYEVIDGEYEAVPPDGLTKVLFNFHNGREQFGVLFSPDKVKIEIEGSDLWITNLVSGERQMTIDHPGQLLTAGLIKKKPQGSN
jgi:hypothetical protein